METKILNEFIFADLVNKYAETIKNERLDSDLNDINAVTPEDLKEAFEHLIWLREETKQIMENNEDLS